MNSRIFKQTTKSLFIRKELESFKILKNWKNINEHISDVHKLKIATESNKGEILMYSDLVQFSLYLAKGLGN